MSPAALIVHRLGQARAAELSRRAGGRRLWVPERLRDAAPLRSYVGNDLAILLVLHFAGYRLYIPRPTRARRGSISPKRVDQLGRRGLSVARIAERLGCSERAVYYAKRKLSRSVSGHGNPKSGQGKSDER